MTTTARRAFELGRRLALATESLAAARRLVQLNQNLPIQDAPQETSDAITLLRRAENSIQDLPLAPGVKEAELERIRDIRFDIRDLHIPVLPNDDAQGRRQLRRNLESLEGRVRDVTVTFLELFEDAPPFDQS